MLLFLILYKHFELCIIYLLLNAKCINCIEGRNGIDMYSEMIKNKHLDYKLRTLDITVYIIRF